MADKFTAVNFFATTLAAGRSVGGALKLPPGYQPDFIPTTGLPALLLVAHASAMDTYGRVADQNAMCVYKATDRVGDLITVEAMPGYTDQAFPAGSKVVAPVLAEHINGLVAGGAVMSFRWNLGNRMSVSTGTDMTGRMMLPIQGLLKAVSINAKTAPVTGSTILDINYNGASLWAANQANRPKLVSGATTYLSQTFDSTSLVGGGLFTIDVDQVASTPGTGLVVELHVLVQGW